MLGNGSRVFIANFGESASIIGFKNLKLCNVLHVPQLVKNLISVKRLCIDNNVVMEFFPNSFYVKDVVYGHVLFSGSTHQ